MSLTAALNTAVSGLAAQSTALSAISENIANESTTAYKTKEVSFNALVSGNLGANSISGVRATTGQAISSPGLIESTGIPTNVAVNGNGFFVVSDDVNNKPSGYAYSRNGSFSTDAGGNLINSEGYYLLGYKTDANGGVLASSSNNLNSLEPISVDSISGAAQSTSKLSMAANLPADAQIGDVFTTSVEMFDSLGVSHTIEQDWTKDAANQWTLSLNDPYVTGTPGTSSGAVSPSVITVAFDGKGILSATNPDPLDITISNFTTGAEDNSFILDLGTVGQSDGLTQKASNFSTPDVEIFSTSQDGARYGQLTDIGIDDAGLVTAFFDNGLSQTIYQIPIATFQNSNGLTHIDGTVYDESYLAGNLNLTLPGQGSAGKILAGSLETSNTDTATEFNKMIIAQQAYSSAAKVITAANEMYDTLLQAIR